MSHYEHLIKQHEALTRELHGQFPNIGMLEYLDEELEEMEEDIFLSEVERLNNCNLIVE